PRRDEPAHSGCHHQGTMDLRTGPPADERRTRPRPLRGPILARPSPTCAHDNDRLRLPSASSPHPSETGKKESTDRHLSQACPPCVTPSSASSCDHCSDARTVEYGYAARGLKKICQSSVNPCCQNQIPCWAEIIPSSDVQGIQLQAFDSGGESRIREAGNRAESARFPVFSRLSANLTA